MPGPMSTPMHWTADCRNAQGKGHGVSATETHLRKSGKTAWTHASGQWANTRANKVARMERQRSRSGKKEA